MDFEQKKKKNDNEEQYHIENLRIVRDFSKKLILEMDDLVKAIVIFGSNTHDTLDKDSDIDLMIILDNVSVFVTDELKEAYRIIVSKLASKYPNKLHLMSVNFSDYWDMVRKGDPIVINVLRYGIPLYDKNIIAPMQYLLEIGKIKPSRETVYTYMARSQTLLEETSKHLDDSVLDLYYAIIDMVHASLIVEKKMPPSPKEMPHIFKETFKNKPLAKYSKIIEEFYKIAKGIEHKKGIKINGVKYDELKIKAEEVVLELKKHIDVSITKKDLFEL
ncbi:MAG: nucleotidyltransferase domain-containing protein [Candidatus Woesearchaeota archaeon]|jgi:predicted nucleotidyltransferase|nr:nucleotidyltransferase domain-containing protein [Candidatus Woesearchaeota archaeon]